MALDRFLWKDTYIITCGVKVVLSNVEKDERIQEVKTRHFGEERYVCRVEEERFVEV